MPRYATMMFAAAMLVQSAQVDAQELVVEEYVLDNGMRFLLYPRAEEPNTISAGWVARVGSVNERPGITGISHFFEHMMFKGTTTIGTRDADKDAWYRSEQERVRGELRELQTKQQYDRWRSGEISDPWARDADTEDMRQLREELDTLITDHKDVIVKDEFDRVYTELGGTGMNAFTSEDMTFYFIGVPSNKLELWAWMESDRLADSVFREFYSERDVVHEERRLRTESTPTGVFDEQLNALFWESSPYSWPVVGWPTDLNSYTMAQARDYFDTYYAPGNLTGIIVGDFDPEQARPLIDQYFGRLDAGPLPPPVVTLEMPQLAEKRMEASCDCPPSVEIRYHTVPFNHPDSFALDVASSILNGRTGRLYKGMVEGDEVASGAFAGTDHKRYGGLFYFSAETKGDAEPADLEAAWDREVEKLQAEPVTEEELARVKNRSLADAYRRLDSNFYIMLQLGYFEALGSWTYLNTEPAAVQQVTAEDVQRVAKAYFSPENRTVAWYQRDASAPPEDPALTALLEGMPGEMAQMMRSQARQIKGLDDTTALDEAIGQMEGAKSRFPAEFVPALDYLMNLARERKSAIEGGDQ